MNESDANKSEVLNNVVDSCESDWDDNQVNDGFKKGEGYHVVPPPYTRNYMPPRADLSFIGLDNSVFKSKESDCEDEYMFEPKEAKKTLKPSLEKIKFVNARNTSVENENKAENLRSSVRVLGDSPQYALQDQGIFDSGCSRYMTRNKSYLTDYQEIDSGFIEFGGNAKGDKITRKDDEVTDDDGKKSTEVLRKENGVLDLAKEGYKNDQEKDVRYQEDALRKQLEQESKRLFGQGEATNTNSTSRLNTVSSPINAVSTSFTIVDPGRERTQRNKFKSMFGQDKDVYGNRTFTFVSIIRSTYVYLGGSIPVNAATLPNVDLPTDPLMPDLEDTTDTRIFSGAYDDEVEGTKADFNNLELTTVISPISITKIHKDHPKEQIIRDPLLALQTRRMTKTSQEHAMVSYIKKKRRINHKDYQNCLLACFLSQIEPKKVIQALTDLSWINAIQDKYVADSLKKFDFSSMKTTSTPIETNKALIKDEEAEDQAVVANSTTEVEYVAATNCCGQGFAAALAVLNIEESQSRKHDMSEPVKYYLID
uniref:Uncharacterized protein n=1 Tax=Tanacetum cinerariifolium TaxID=118510 RepID=A0A699H9C8_TANCI|nr:hypothetical protein [Tanacetum cinerariifolium]